MPPDTGASRCGNGAAGLRGGLARNGGEVEDVPAESDAVLRLSDGKKAPLLGIWSIAKFCGQKSGGVKPGFDNPRVVSQKGEFGFVRIVSTDSAENLAVFDFARSVRWNGLAFGRIEEIFVHGTAFTNLRRGFS